MTINKRIRELRKEMGLKQQDFGTKIGLGQGAISWMEKDGNTVIDQNIRLICDTFNVSENWLRTGAGPKESANNKRDILAEVCESYKLNNIEERVLRIYLQLDESSRDIISEYVKKLSAAIATIPEATETNSVTNATGGGALPRQEDVRSPDRPAEGPRGNWGSADASARPDGLSDEEWQLLQLARREKNQMSDTSISSSSGMNQA